MTSNNTSTPQRLQHQPSFRKSFLRKHSFESSGTSHKWRALLDQRGRNFLIPEDLFLAVYRSGLNSPPEELAPCLNLIQADHYDAATLDTQLEALFAQNGVWLEELTKRLKYWGDHGLPPHPGQFPNDKSRMKEFFICLTSQLVPFGNVFGSLLCEHPKYSEYEASIYAIVDHLSRVYSLAFWACIATSIFLTASGAAVKSEVLTVVTNAVVFFLLSWGAHSAHRATMWSKPGYKVRHWVAYRRFVLTHSIFPSRGGKSAYSVLLDLLSPIKGVEEYKSFFSSTLEHTENHERTATQRPGYDKFDLWPLDNRRRGESHADSLSRKFSVFSLTGEKAWPAFLGLLRAMLPFVVQASLGTLKGRNWGDHLVSLCAFGLTSTLTMFFVLIVQVGASDEGVFMTNMAKSLVDLIDVTNPNRSGGAQIFLSTRKDVDAFKNLLQWMAGYLGAVSRYHLAAIEVIFLVSLGSLAVLFLIMTFGADLAEWNVLLMFDGFAALVISTRVLDGFLSAYHILSDDVVVALHGQKMSIDEFLMGHAGTSSKEEREEMRQVQLMIANMITIIEEARPITMFGIFKVNRANVAKMSLTMGAVFASMAYERVRESG